MNDLPAGPETTTAAEKPQLRFALKGFSEVTGFRVFEFDGIAADWARTPFTVRTDLALSRRYGIRLQELPLLCRAVLERREGTEEQRAFAYGEADMRIHADGAAARAAAAKLKKPRRKPVTDQPATAWRVFPR